MRNIFLSIVVVCALVIAGVGGTLAGFSDTEESEGNKIEMGSIDLKVNDTDDEPWGKGVGALIELTTYNPDEEVFEDVSVRNAGDKDGYLYIHIKNLDCYNIETEHSSWWYAEPDPPYGLKPEPELVAEYGGKVDCTWVDGIGVNGDNCCMGKSTRVAIGLDDEWIIGSPESPVTLGQLECWTGYLGMLPKCGGEHFVNMYVIVPQILDETWDNPKELPELAYWPTNSLMADGVTFDIEFLLFDRMLDNNG